MVKDRSRVLRSVWCHRCRKIVVIKTKMPICLSCSITLWREFSKQLHEVCGPCVGTGANKNESTCSFCSGRGWSRI